MNKQNDLEQKELTKEIENASKELESVKLNYSKDKTGWVIFKNGKKKIKLRKHISNIAVKLQKLNELSYTKNREFLMKTYNNYGLKGVNSALLDGLAEYKVRKQKEAQQLIEDLKNIKQTNDEE